MKSPAARINLYDLTREQLRLQGADAVGDTTEEHRANCHAYQLH